MRREFRETDSDGESMLAWRKEDCVMDHLRKHPLVCFFVLAYALSWWPWLLVKNGEEGDTITPLGPLVAALIMLAVLGGLPEVRTFVGRILHWRVGLRWYFVAAGLPVLIDAAAAMLNFLMGAEPVAGFAFPGIGELAGKFAFVFVLIGIGEEPAWRGFALPRLMAGRTALAASPMLAAFHVVWHLPLFGIEYHAWNMLPWILSLTSFAVIMTWVYLHTGGSLLLPALAHASVNTSAVVFQMFAGNDLVRLWWLFGGLWVLVAAIVIAAFGPALTKGAVAR
jgi:uncharacterized protein